MNKIAVLFPGVGYTAQKPLLYYAGKYFKAQNYNVIALSFHDFPDRLMNDQDKLKQAYQIAYSQTVEQLEGVDLRGAQTVFVGKSIGTYAAAAYAFWRHLEVTEIMLTPLEDTFEYIQENALVVSGKEDPWVDPEHIVELAIQHHCQLLRSEGNHSLEVPDDVIGNIERVKETIITIDQYMRQ